MSLRRRADDGRFELRAGQQGLDGQAGLRHAEQGCHPRQFLRRPAGYGDHLYLRKALQDGEHGQAGEPAGPDDGDPKWAGHGDLPLLGPGVGTGAPPAKG